VRGPALAIAIYLTAVFRALAGDSVVHTTVIDCGLKITAEADKIRVAGFWPGSPAERSGKIRIGDEIVGILTGPLGQQLFVAFEGRSLTEAAFALTRQEVLTLQLSRPDAKEGDGRFFVTLTAANYELPPGQAIKRGRSVVSQTNVPFQPGTAEFQKWMDETLLRSTKELLSSPKKTAKPENSVPQPSTAANPNEGLSPSSLPQIHPSAEDALSVEPTQPMITLPGIGWHLVTNGMTDVAVLSVLGAPKTVKGGETAQSEWIYGWLRFQSISIPVNYTFSVNIVDGKVTAKNDPWEGASSSDGKPTKPKLLKPKDNASFDHLPRFIDCRWAPSAGRYPIEYTVEVAKKLPSGEWHTEQRRTAIPYYCTIFEGIGSGRWRVKASNTLGESQWSAFETFQFMK